MQYLDKPIGFAKDLVPLVQNKTKKLTYRLGDKYNFLKTGDEISVKDSSTEKIFGKIKITNISKTNFKDLPIDIDKHEKYISKEEQKKTFEQYYPNQVNDESPVIIIEFEFLN